jgi:Family of unknown function (DUF6172)
MKKTFPLQVPGKPDRRVLELIRAEVGKYLNREKRKRVPEDFDHWEFACKVGPDQATAVATDVKQVPAAIDAVAASGSAEVYVEITSSPQPRPGDADPFRSGF